MRRSSVPAFKTTIRLLIMLPLGLLLGAAPSDPLAPFRRAVAVHAHEMRGVLVYERHVDFELRLGPTMRTDRNDAEILLMDGQYYRIKFHEMARYGRPVPAEGVEKEERRANAELHAGKGFFKEPYDEHYAEDYRVVPEACEDCPAGAAQFRFTSDMRDAQHGAGTLVIDAAGHAVRTVYTPYVMHDHVSTGTITEVAEEVLPGTWAITRVEERYKGRIALVSGNAVLRMRRERYRRYPKVEMALEAMGAQSQ